MLDRGRLEAEAVRISLALFGKTPEQVFLDRYVDAHAKFDMNESPSDLRLLAMLLAKPGYMEAVEYVLRLRNDANVLTKKFKIVHYLAECQASSYDNLFQKTTHVISAWAGLVLLVFHTFSCLVRGWYFLKRHHIA